MTTCEFCNKPAYKSNSKSELICENRAYRGSCDALKPIRVDKKPGNNDPCYCGKPLKYKHCCKYKKE